MENEKYIFKLEETEYRGELTEGMVTYVRQLVRSKYRKRPIPNTELEDAEQFGLEYVLKYIKRHDPKKAPLAGYINTIVSSALRDLNRYATKPHRHGPESFSYEVAYSGPKENSSQVGESALSYLDRNYSKVGLKVDLFFYAPLTALEKKIVQLMYIETAKTEISRRLGISMNRLNALVDLIGTKYLLGTFFYRYRSENSEQ